jgi:hypothetical protein
MLPRRAAGIVSRHTRFANVRSPVVDRAGRPDANRPDKGGAPVAVAPHAPPRVIDKRARNPAEIGLGFQREPRPFRRKRAACAAALTGSGIELGLLRTGVHLSLPLTADSLPPPEG